MATWDRGIERVVVPTRFMDDEWSRVGDFWALAGEFMPDVSERSRMLFRVALLVVLVMVFCGFLLLQADRPVATIIPGSSAGPSFVVQVIRPRVGLPLGGILPPQLFGIDAHLGFDSKSPGAVSGGVESGRIEFGADGWRVLLVFDDRGQVTSASEVLFELEFEDRRRRVRCRPGSPVIGEFHAVSLSGVAGLSGHFDIELPFCEDAVTGRPLRWPPKPLVLHGSFDRLQLNAVTGSSETGSGHGD